MEQMHPFNWDFKNPNAEKYGRYYWGILLNDGRYIYVHADKAVITDTGDLMMMTSNRYSLNRAERKMLDNLHEDYLEATKYQDDSSVELIQEAFTSRANRLKQKENEIVLDPYMVIAKSHWVSYFGANVMTGEPVSLDNAYKFDKTNAI
jgi:hypothetical protein